MADLRKHCNGELDSYAIANLIASAASNGPTAFECTGASPEFEEVIEQLRLRGFESIVVLLDCSIETAIRRVHGQPGRLQPRSGGTWADQMRWTESQLRLVPADITILQDVSDSGSIVNSVRQAWEYAAHKPRKMSAPQEISFSQLAAFEVCPLSYKLKYINGQAEALETPWMYLGSRLHETLAWLYGRASHHRSKSELIDWFEKRLAESLPNGVSTDSVRHLYEAGRKALVFHYDVAYSNERTRTLAVEKRIRMNLGVGTTFVGRVDRISLDSSGTVEVIDYKTSPIRRNSRPRIPRWPSDRSVQCRDVARSRAIVGYCPSNNPHDWARREIRLYHGGCTQSNVITASLDFPFSGMSRILTASWITLLVLPI